MINLKQINFQHFLIKKMQKTKKKNTDNMKKTEYCIQ